MDTKEVKKLLAEARKNREYGQFAEALAILHQINNEFAGNVQYRYLLAATYYETWSTEAALKYAEEAIQLDPTYKETYELIGDIYDKQGDRKKAITNYEKAYQLDDQYIHIEEKLIQAYLKEREYEKVLTVCDHLIKHTPIDISSAKTRILTSIHMATVLYKAWALVYLKKYEEAIAELFNRREINARTNLPSYPGQYKDDDESIFKMYYKLQNPEKIEAYRALLIENYKLTEEEIKELEEDAKKDIILKRQKHNLS